MKQFIMPLIGNIKKEVGQTKPKTPLKQAMRLKEMLEQSLGKTKLPAPNENVRGMIGQP